MMNRPARADLGTVASAGHELSMLRIEVARAQAMLGRLQGEIVEAEQQLDSHPSVQLLEANEHLVTAALRAQAAADTAAETAAQALKDATRSAEFDALTQLPNRLQLMDRLAQAMAGARRRGARAAVLFLDLNNFKQVNDTLGHAVGDQVLKEVAGRLAASIRAADTVSRHGGDEFLVVMAEIGEIEDAVLIADKLASALSDPCRVGGHLIEMGVSIGISLFPDDGEDADTLIDHADTAMYQAKRLGTRSCLYGAVAAAPAGGAPARPLHPLREANGQLVVAALAAQQLQAVAERARAEQMQALAFVAHELRNPLMSLRAAAATLRRGGVDERLLQRVQAVIERQVNHMSRMVGDLLDMSRASTGKLRLECRSVDLGELLAEAVLAFRPVLEERRQTFEVSVPGGPLPMRGDAVRLTQVVSNLLDNAAKYTPRGGDIGLSLAVSGQWLVLTVSDNGIGIAPESLPRVFEPFVQDRQAVGHDSAGLGIGLTVVRELVVAHGGHVSAFSAGPGCGSRFTVMLPAGAG
jgi:diguanylate cyclase (GGDEF)-like protein